MKLKTSAILSLLGSILALIGLFIPAVYGIVENGINSSKYITMIEMHDGYIFLIAAILGLIFTFIVNLEKWTWIFGAIIGILGILELLNTVEVMHSLYAKAPMFKDFISFGPGIFVTLLGGILILISRLFFKTNKKHE